MFEGDFEWVGEGCVGSLGKRSRHHSGHHGLICSCNCLKESRSQGFFPIGVTYEGHSS